jgi:hypothetical protein
MVNSSPANPRAAALEGLRNALQAVTVQELRGAARLWGWTVKGTAKAEIIQYLLEHLTNAPEMAAAFRALSPILQQAAIWLAHLGRTDDQGEMLRLAIGMAEGRDLPKATVTRTIGDLRQRLLLITDAYQGTHVPEAYNEWLPLADAPGLAYQSRSSAGDIRFQGDALLPAMGLDLLDQHVEHLLSLVERERPLVERPSAPAPRSPQLAQRGILPGGALPGGLMLQPHGGIVSSALLTRWGYAGTDEQNLARVLLCTLVTAGLCRGQEQGAETRLVTHTAEVQPWRDLSSETRQATLRSWWGRTAPAIVVTASATQALLTWDELDIVLAAPLDYSLRQGVDWLGREHLDVQVRYFRSWLLNLVTGFKEDVWYSVSRLLELIYHLRRDLFFWTAYHVGWNWYDGETPLNAHQMNQRIWSETYGALVEAWLVGPANWLGIVQVALEDGRAVAFMRPSSPTSASGAQLAADSLRFLPDGRLTLRNSWQTSDLRQLIRKIAVETARDRETTAFAMAPAAFRQTLRDGQSAEQVIQAFEAAGFALPQTHVAKLHDWQARVGRHQIYDNLGVIEFSDDETLAEVQATTGLGRADLYPISPRCLVALRPEAVPGLLEELRRKGYTPQVVS